MLEIKIKKVEKLQRDKQGIVTIIGLVMMTILLVIFAWLSPLIAEAINISKETVTDPLGAMLLDMFMFFILLGILISWFIYAGAK
ncbi:MAG: hypothetical protein ACTSPO_15990 [Candidatus Heimdallarchaeaceae archaeon]